MEKLRRIRRLRTKKKGTATRRSPVRYSTSREIYVKAPEEGLPAARGEPPVDPFELLQILTGF